MGIFFRICFRDISLIFPNKTGGKYSFFQFAPEMILSWLCIEGTSVLYLGSLSIGQRLPKYRTEIPPLQKVLWEGMDCSGLMA